MLYAIFSDVHGNLLALEKFIQEAASKVEAYICLGDVVNYGPWNDECLEMVCNLPNIIFLEGNHERIFSGKEDIHHEIPLVQKFYANSIKSFSHIELVKNLRSSYELNKFLCTHTIENKSIYPDSKLTVTQNYILGHTHHQFQINSGEFLIINPGSVGQNRRWINMVDYLIFNDENNTMELCSVEYEFERFLNELKARKYPEECISYYYNKLRK